MRLATVNAFNLYGDPDDQERHRQVEELIGNLDADVIAVQEIISKGETAREKQPGAVAGLRRLAAAVDRECDVDGVPAVAVGGVIHHTGLLWRPGGRRGRALTPVAGSVHTLTREGAGMWHCAVSVVFTVAGKKVRAGSVQLSPFDQSWCAADANQLLRVFNRDDVPGLDGGDFNGNGATTVLLRDGGEVFYDPDPYVGVAWHPDHVYQLDADGHVDRQAAIRLERLGRMRDCARITNSAWAPTTGAHPADAHPPRRIDRWYATHHLPDAAVVGYRVVDAATVNRCTDHQPVVLEVDEDALTA